VCANDEGDSNTYKRQAKRIAHNVRAHTRSAVLEKPNQKKRNNFD
jgi:hypothetical protein